VRLCCVPLADEVDHPQAFYAGRRLVAIDGSCFELPDEPDNAQAFGYPGSRTSVAGHAGYPQARCVALVECATHAILGASIGPYRSGEWDLAEQLLPHLGSGMLCLADRGFNGFEQWRQAAATGADLLWRCSDTRQLPVLQLLQDGSFLTKIGPSGAGAARTNQQAITVRVIEYTMPGDGQALTRYRLLTTLLDAAAAPAVELAALYHQRWEIEAVFDELKTHLRQGRRVLRSKTAELVRQEFYGWVLAHYAVRWLLHRGASRHRMQHAELSFKGHVELLRRAQPRSGAFPPTAAQTETPLVQ
jgi:hypothetical protein